MQQQQPTATTTPNDNQNTPKTMSMSVASFIAGFCYGGTTVLVGQPLDTIKTLQQTACHSQHTRAPRKSIAVISRELWASGGIPNFYRGGMPLLLGGGLMRSAQFGVYMSTLQYIQSMQQSQNQPSSQKQLVLGCIDPQVGLAGICGGLGRGLSKYDDKFKRNGPLFEKYLFMVLVQRC
jgi:hypothetical protein